MSFREEIEALYPLNTIQDPFFQDVMQSSDFQGGLFWNSQHSPTFSSDVQNS